MKVAIVDLKGEYAAALTENGEVKRLFNNHYEIGQEIELYDIQEVRQPRIVPRVIRRVAAVAAAIIILLVGSIGTAYAIPCGTVSLESDPSIEYTVNCFDYVIGVKALNEDGETVLEEIGVSNLKHHKIGDAVTTTVEQMKDDGFFEDDNKGVSITASTGNDTHNDRLREDLESAVSRDNGVPINNNNNPAQTDKRLPDSGMENNREQDQQQNVPSGQDEPANQNGSAERNKNSQQQNDPSSQQGEDLPNQSNSNAGPDQNTAQNSNKGNQPQIQQKP